MTNVCKFIGKLIVLATKTWPYLECPHLLKTVVFVIRDKKFICLQYDSWGQYKYNILFLAIHYRLNVVGSTIQSLHKSSLPCQHKHRRTKNSNYINVFQR